jgi:hypothetical protein
MGSRFVVGLLAVALGGLAAVAAEPAAKGRWTLPRPDADRWVTRIRRLTPGGWTVSARGNDIVLQRDRPVRFARVEVNAPPAPGPGRPPPDLHEGAFRLTLRFAPLLALDEYEKLAAENAAADRERDRLQQAVGLPHKFDEFVAVTPEEKGRVRAYRQAVGKLRWHELPDLYAPDYSIFLYRSYEDGWSYVYDKGPAAECRDVEASLLRYFGMYSPGAAAGRQVVGRAEPPSER